MCPDRFGDSGEGRSLADHHEPSSPNEAFTASKWMALLGVPQRSRYTRDYGKVTASSYRATTGIATRKPFETSRRDGEVDVVDEVQYMAYALKPAGQ